MTSPGMVGQQYPHAQKRVIVHDVPLVTYALLAYNQERSIDAAIESALAQTWGNLEIILSDDCSSDHTFEAMERAKRAYSGPHKIILNQNDTNVGIAQHVNVAMALTHGGLVIAAAGDDLSDPNRTAKLVSAWATTGFSASVFHSGYNTIDGDGNILRTTTVPEMINPCAQNLIFNNVVKGATQAWSRKLFDFFGPLSSSLCQEDLNITMRGAMLDGVSYIPEPLVDWRTGGASNNGATSIRDARRRNAIWYTADMAQAILDFQTALRKHIIDENRYNSLVSSAGDRLMFEALLMNRNVVSLVRACILEAMRVCRRSSGSIYKSLLLAARSREQPRLP